MSQLLNPILIIGIAASMFSLVAAVWERNWHAALGWLTAALFALAALVGELK